MSVESQLALLDKFADASEGVVTIDVLVAATWLMLSTFDGIKGQVFPSPQEPPCILALRDDLADLLTLFGADDVTMQAFIGRLQ